MNLSCDIVMDLVSLYKDGLASAASREAIEAHLRQCPSCRKFYKHYNSAASEVPEPDTGTIGDYMQRYADLSMKLRRKRNLFTGVVAGCACLAAAAILMYAIEKTHVSSAKA